MEPLPFAPGTDILYSHSCEASSLAPVTDILYSHCGGAFPCTRYHAVHRHFVEGSMCNENNVELYCTVCGTSIQYSNYVEMYCTVQYMQIMHARGLHCSYEW